MNLQFLKQKKFGLPIWTWALIVAVMLVLLYLYYRHKSSSSSSTATQAATPAPADTTPNLSTLGDGSGGGGSFSPTPDSGAGYSVGRGYTGRNQQPQQPVIVELEQTPTTSTDTSTTPPKSPAASVTAASILKSIGVAPGSQTINPIPGTGVSIDTADIPPNLLNKPIVPLPSPTAPASQPPIKVSTQKTLNTAIAQGSGGKAVGSGKTTHKLGGGL